PGGPGPRSRRGRRAPAGRRAAGTQRRREDPVRAGTLALALAVLAGCKPQAAPAPAAKPASVVAKEGELLTVTLTAEAEQRLGIKISPVELKKVERIRS